MNKKIVKLHFGSFKLFPSSKIDFWLFLKLQKMEFGQNIFFVKLIYLISRVLFAWTFLFNFLAHCDPVNLVIFFSNPNPYLPKMGHNIFDKSLGPLA